MTKNEFKEWLAECDACIRQLRAERAPQHEIDRWISERELCVERLASAL